MVAFFVCGTPSNNGGFQFVELGPGKLPGSRRPIWTKRRRGRRVSPNRVGLRRRATLRPVQPSAQDQSERLRGNRGAYIAVGCLIGDPLPTQSVSNCVDIVSEIFGGVCSALNPARSFPVGYRFADYVYQGAPLSDRLAHQCSPLLLTDVLWQALHNEGSFQGARRETTHPGSQGKSSLPTSSVISSISAKGRSRAAGRRQGARSGTRDRPPERCSSGAAGRAAERVAVLAGDRRRRRFRAHQEGQALQKACRRGRARGRTR